ncbi:PQQ-binding-like beta-propeller repeat protein [bacterium]|nr:PQQ-binding-like beta-propeller repeat protein [bacterium]
MTSYRRTPRSRTPLFASCLALILLCTHGRADVAQTLLALAGTGANGVCAFPRCTDGSVPMAVATNTSLVVHVMNADAASVAFMRDHSGSPSVLGRTLYIEKGTLDVLPYASDSLDALFLTDVTDDGLAGLATGEIMRVLAPCVGRAVIGRATGAAGTLTRESFEAWALQWGGPGSHVVENADGLWAVIARAPLAGAEDWTHPFHGPDNNPVSGDGAFSFPSAVAWLGKPYHLLWRNIGGRIIANGRLYLAFGPNNDYTYRAYNVYNGSLLWERALDTNTWAQRHLNACVDGGRVYLMQQAHALVLDAASGAEVDRITFTNVTGQGKWMTVASNLLVMLIGPMDIVDSGWLGSRNAMFPKRDSMDLGYGTLLVAHDLAARAEKWRVDEGARIDSRTVGVSAGRIIYHAPAARVVCRDVMTGGVIWTNADPAAMAVMDSKFGATSAAWWGPSAAAGLEERYSMLCTPEIVCFGKPEGSNFAVFSSADGRLLWSRARNGGRVFNFISCTNDKLFVNSVVNGGFINPLTGAQLSSPGGVGSGCGVLTANRHYLMDQIGGPEYDFARMRSIVFANQSMYSVKNECSLGGIIACGRYVAMTKSCTCAHMRGSVALCAGRAYPSQSGLLETAGGAPPLGLASDGLDWPTYRATAGHGGATPVAVPVAVSNTWRIPARFPTEPFTVSLYTKNMQNCLTPPLAVGDLVFVAGSDGVIQCIETATGAERWRYRAGGAVLAAPTFAMNRLFVGSADGWVYALEAATGRLLWRYRPAPEERKLMVYGYLQSSWPVNSGIHFDNGIVYAAAGLPAQPGSYVFALDAATGALIWQNDATGPRHDTGSDTYGDSTRVPAGYITSVNSTIWVRAYQAGLGGLAFTQGTGVKLTDVSPNSLRGRNIGVVSNSFIIWGGPETYADNTERGGKFSMGITEVVNGAPRKYGVSIPSIAMPAWTDERMIIPTIGGADAIECWSTPVMLDYYRDLIVKHTVNWDIVFTPPASNPLPQRVWRAPVTNVYALALCDNLVVAAVVTNKLFYGQLSEFGGRLRAYDLADGAIVWDIALPSPPMREGMCVDRYGRIIVCLHDGSIICFAGTNAQARARIADESCSSAAPGAGINGSGGGAGWSSTWRAGAMDVFTNGLAFPGWDACGAAMQVVSNASRTFNGAGSGADGATNWFSFLFQSPSPGHSIRWFSDGAAGSGVGVDLAGTGGGTLFAALGATRAASGAGGIAGGATHLAIGRIAWSANAGGDSMSVWVDPNSWHSEEAVASSAAGTSAVQGDAPAQFDGAAQVCIGGGAGSALACDELRLGATLESVRPVPEPAIAMAILVLVAATRAPRRGAAL